MPALCYSSSTVQDSFTGEKTEARGAEASFTADKIPETYPVSLALGPGYLLFTRPMVVGCWLIL